MASVTLEHIKKEYENHVVAVHDFNLRIRDKEFIVFVGPSGCGKSTTLRMVAGLEDISGGTLKIGDRVVNDVEPKDRDIAMVFQNYALYPHITVYENMAFSLRIRKMNNEEIHKRVCQAAEILGITEYLGRKPKQLSGGQRQRVAIGRAIVREPQVFLMDEPLSNLDAKLRNQMRAEIILLRKRIDTTFIYVTHDQTEAMTLGDRIVVMKDGYIQQVGTPQQVFDTPKNLFVAGFIGSPQMNFIKAKLQENAGKYAVDVLGIHVPLDEEPCAVLKQKHITSQDIIMGVRPEHTAVSFEKGPNTIRSKIQVVEMMGSELHMHLTTDSGDSIILRLPTIDLTREQRASLKSGNELYFTFPSKVIHIFDPKTEMSLLYNENEDDQ
ncbi:MAG: sn-glycerol-3-phosphate ABC transporter ATP-binding protein UgpC [Clostridia bacterium]|nr:sn-glycerol-3-phosphate ABC transporter ATP-binding protein UgpC [Clostridia bacterium]MBQ9288811.1 sn-glycerol-3-phosphate ABC transporter ATP-binding protein UgpC [Clostridia bacterium]